MDRRVLVIGETSSFIVNAIQTNLKKSDYEVIFVKPEINAINQLKDKPKIILLYLEDNAKQWNNIWVFIKDLCAEEEKHLYLVGYKEEIEEAIKVIPEMLISGTFGRPLNVKLLVDHLNLVVEKDQEETKKKHILIVDDSGPMLRTIKSWLASKYQVSMANSGMSAITFLATNTPDLILLDYEMPVCSGPQTMEMIRSEISSSTIPIIFLTSKGDRESVMKVLELKPEGYLLKTMKPEEIVKAIDQHFEAKKMKMSNL